MEIIMARRQPIVKNMQNAFFVLSIVLLYSLLAVRDVFELSFHPLLPIIFICFCMIFFDESQVLAYILSIVITNNTMPYLYSVLFGIIIVGLKNIDNIKIGRKVLPILLILLLEILHAFMEPFNIVKYFKWTAPFLLMALYISIDGFKPNMKLIVRTFTLVCILNAFIILCNAVNISGEDPVTLFESGYRLGAVEYYPQTDFRFMGNANSIGFYCNIALCANIMLFQKYNNKVLSVLLMIMLVIFGLMTISRSFIVVLICLLVMSLFVSKSSIKNKLFMILGIMALFSVIAIIVVTEFPYLLESFGDRFSEEDITGHRLDGLIFYVDVLLENPVMFLFGIGSQNILHKINSMGYYFPFVPHNCIIDVVTCLGIVGLFTIIWIYVELINDAKHINKGMRFINIVPLIIQLIDMQAVQFISSGINVFLLILIYYLMTLELNPSSDDRAKKIK